MEPKEKAEIIIEALPYIKKYNNKIVVIKFGGNVITKSENVIEDIVLLKNIGIKPVIGAKKRLIRLNEAISPNKIVPNEAPTIQYMNLIQKSV